MNPIYLFILKKKMSTTGSGDGNSNSRVENCCSNIYIFVKARLKPSRFFLVRNCFEAPEHFPRIYLLDSPHYLMKAPAR
jgi:hypothetical protein